MTEAEWLAGDDLNQLLRWVGRPATERKARLFAYGCCRAVWELLVDKRSRLAIQKLERAADDGLNSKIQRDAYNIAHAAYRELRSDTRHPLRAACWSVVAAALRGGSERDGNIATAMSALPGWEGPDVVAFECNLLRCIFGNPFRPVAFDPRWRSETAVALAAGIYDGRHFDRLPILADALEDAGCEHPDMLNHLRGPGPHARGCWPLDLVLGRE